MIRRYATFAVDDSISETEVHVLIEYPIEKRIAQSNMSGTQHGNNQ